MSEKLNCGLIGLEKDSPAPNVWLVILAKVKFMIQEWLNMLKFYFP